MEQIQPIIDFFNHPIFIIVGGVTVVYAVLGLLYRIGCIVFGISPLVLRIGTALWRRKIAIFGSAEAFNSLKSSLTDSGVFKDSNINHIPLDNIDKGKEYTVYLVDWDSSKEHIEQILSSRVSHNTAAVIFARPATIPNEIMNDIANRANTVVVNFRGRLLNDMLNSLVTTSFK